MTDYNQITDYTQIYIEQNGIIAGIIRDGISYELTRQNSKTRCKGKGRELIIPDSLKHIYEELNEESIFNIIIKNTGLCKLKDVVLYPPPREIYMVKNVVIIRNFEFCNW